MSLYELFIGFRYLKAKKSQGFISFNTLLSIFIVFIGVFMLIVVISVMNGFQSQIKDKILDVDSHITITNAFVTDTGEGIRNYNALMDKVRDIPGIKSVYPFIQGQGLLRYKSYISPVVIRGMGKPGDMPADLKKFIKEGPKEFTRPSDVFIGVEMSWNYNIRKGESLEIIVPKGRLTAKTGINPGIGTYRVAGLFKTGYYEFDTKLIVLSLPASQSLYDLGNVAWGVGIKINDIYKMDAMASRVRQRVGFDYEVQTAEQRNQNLFYALRLEKLIMTIILFLVIISAGFTIMGTLVMVVMEKRKAIGILKSMGARPISIMVVFILEGFLIGVTGAFAGVVLGIATALNLEAIIKWVELKINGIMGAVYSAGNFILDVINLVFKSAFSMGAYQDVSLVPKNVYYIDTIPTEVNPEFVVLIAVFAVFLSTVAAIFPSWQASRLRPVETIRYE
ncbi:MAG: ABC transporter permease [Spirochaetes bacterium]|nr:ABC transporter permease [Spirochaetota bacterium]